MRDRYVTLRLAIVREKLSLTMHDHARELMVPAFYAWVEAWEKDPWRENMRKECDVARMLLRRRRNQDRSRAEAYDEALRLVTLAYRIHKAIDWDDGTSWPFQLALDVGLTREETEQR